MTSLARPIASRALGYAGPRYPLSLTLGPLPQNIISARAKDAMRHSRTSRARRP